MHDHRKMLRTAREELSQNRTALSGGRSRQRHSDDKRVTRRLMIFEKGNRLLRNLILGRDNATGRSADFVATVPGLKERTSLQPRVSNKGFNNPLGRRYR